MQALVLSDTHIHRGGRRQLPKPVLAAADKADIIIHAGDIVTGAVLEQLGTAATVHAVLGNNDHELVDRLPASVQLELDGLVVAVVHDSGPAQGRPNRMKRMFPAAQLVVFGHSHLPFSGTGAGDQWLLNPGSSTERRRAPTHTYGWLVVQDGALVTADLVDIGV